jgi:hypothetical protein
MNKKPVVLAVMFLAITGCGNGESRPNLPDPELWDNPEVELPGAAFFQERSWMQDVSSWPIQHIAIPIRIHLFILPHRVAINPLRRARRARNSAAAPPPLRSGLFSLNLAFHVPSSFPRITPL